MSRACDGEQSPPGAQAELLSAARVLRHPIGS
jgi:hypothetical protein